MASSTGSFGSPLSAPSGPLDAGVPEPQLDKRSNAINGKDLGIAPDVWLAEFPIADSRCGASQGKTQPPSAQVPPMISVHWPCSSKTVS